MRGKQAIGLGDADRASAVPGSTQAPKFTLPTADKEKQHHPAHGLLSQRAGWPCRVPGDPRLAYARSKALRAPRVPPQGFHYLLDSQRTSVFVPLDQRDWGLCLDRAADVSVYPDGNVDDRGHVHHTGRIWESSSTTLAWGKSPSLPPAWLQRIYFALIMNSKPSTALAPASCYLQACYRQIHRNTWHFWEVLLMPRVFIKSCI